MTAPAQDPTERINLLRQQLILAQVRLQELADAALQLQTDLDDRTSLLAQAQTVADEKLDEVRHLHGLLEETRDRALHWETVANETRTELATAAEQITVLKSDLESVRKKADAAAHALATIKASRLWRWTRWLRPGRDQVDGHA